MGILMILLALLAGWLLGFPDEVVLAGTIGAHVVRLIVETLQDWLEASL